LQKQLINLEQITAVKFMYLGSLLKHQDLLEALQKQLITPDQVPDILHFAKN
jgi:hypothetical protein